MGGCHAIEKLPAEVVYEILAGVERIPQPSPGYAPAGDCFACSSFAIIRHWARAAGVDLPFSLEDLYRKAWAHEDVGAAKGSSFHAVEKFWWRWNDLLGWYGLKLDHVQDAPVAIDALRYAPHMTFGGTLYPPQVLSRRLRTYLEAGYVAHVEMQYEAQREKWKRGEPPHGSDHMVVIDGFRETRTMSLDCSGDGYGAHWSGTGGSELHVVCSASRGAYWIDIGDWVRDHGGFNMWFVRPRRSRALPWPESEPCPQGHLGPIVNEVR